MREAAALLAVSPSTLRSWEERFGYPRPQRSGGGQRRYDQAELIALRDALQSGLGVASAINRVRLGVGIDAESLRCALLALRFPDADAIMEAALALRPLEDAVEDLLVTAAERLAGELGPTSARWALIARWAAGWLTRAHRLSPRPQGDVCLLIADASHPSGLDAVAILALEVLSVRDGARVTRLPVEAPEHAAEIALADRPEVVILAGADSAPDTVARWMYPMRRVLDDAAVVHFRRRVSERHRSECLPDSPLAAQRELRARVARDPLVVRVSRMGVPLPVSADSVSHPWGELASAPNAQR